MIQYTKDADGIAIISFDNKNSSVNVIDAEFLSDFELQISNAISDPSVKGIIITSLKKDFMLGADLKMIMGIKDPKQIMAIANRLHTIFRKMETCGKPVVAAINGTTLGGGYEICLACHHRIAVNDSKIQIGLPEVLLG